MKLLLAMYAALVGPRRVIHAVIDHNNHTVQINRAHVPSFTAADPVPRDLWQCRGYSFNFDSTTPVWVELTRWEAFKRAWTKKLE